MMFKGENASDFILSALPVHTLVSVFFLFRDLDLSVKQGQTENSISIRY